MPASRTSGASLHQIKTPPGKAKNHGNLQHGQHGTLTYMRWKSMMARCNNPKATNYQYYGAKGVKVCAAWHDYPAFLADMGECPDRGMTLDRIKNESGYAPGNCRWATKAAQNKNRSHCVEMTFSGETKILADWARERGITPNALAMRIGLGWSIERALTQPLKKRTTKTPDSEWLERQQGAAHQAATDAGMFDP